MPVNNRIPQAIAELYGLPLDEVTPEVVVEKMDELIDEHKAAGKVAILLKLYAGSVKYWLIRHGYSNIDGQWVKQEAEAIDVAS